MPQIFLIFIIVGSCFSIIGLRIYFPHLWAKETLNSNLQNEILNPNHPPKFYKNFKTLSGTIDQELPNYILLNKNLNNLEKKAKLIHPSLSPSIFASANRIGDSDRKRVDNVLLPLFSVLIVAISIIFAFFLLFRQRTECSKLDSPSPQPFEKTSSRAKHSTDHSGPNWHSLAANLVTFFREYKDPDDTAASQNDDGSATSENDSTTRDHDIPETRFDGKCPARGDVDNTIRDLKALEQLLLSYRKQNTSFINANYDEASFERLIRRLNVSLNQIISDPGVPSKHQSQSRVNRPSFAFQPRPASSHFNHHHTTVGGSCKDLSDPEFSCPVIKRHHSGTVII